MMGDRQRTPFDAVLGQVVHSIVGIKLTHAICRGSRGFNQRQGQGPAQSGWQKMPRCTELSFWLWPGAVMAVVAAHLLANSEAVYAALDSERARHFHL